MPTAHPHIVRLHPWNGTFELSAFRQNIDHLLYHGINGNHSPLEEMRSIMYTSQKSAVSMD